MQPSFLKRTPFGQTADGQFVGQYRLTNLNGASMTVLNYGATITSLLVPDKSGNMGDVVLGFDTVAQYEAHPSYFGATIGRVGNRIARGQFSLDGVQYNLPLNNGEHHLHGGLKAYDRRIWSDHGEVRGGVHAVRFDLLDPDGSEGYPGNVAVAVHFTLTNDNTLRIEYEATTDKPTPINLTNHSYFNLKDGGRSSIADHILQSPALAYTEVNESLIPTGKIIPVKGTPMDFTRAKPLGQDIDKVSPGYDHNLILDNPSAQLIKAAEVFEPQSGRRMEVWTTEPAVQLYTGNFLDGSLVGKNKTAYQQHCAFCLETQHYPDSVNHANFPDTVLRPGQTYRQLTEYRFFVGPG